MRTKVVETLVDNIIDLCAQKRPTEEELVVLLGQLTTRIGFSIHFQNVEDRPNSIDYELAEELSLSHPSVGTALMRLGYDIQDALIEET